jgi:chemotaxis protein methyltransferase CheR
MYPYTAHPQLLPQEFADLRVYLEQSSGIVLGDGKEYLVSSRLGKLLREYRFDSFSELVRELKANRSLALKTAVIDAMTTNETFWFRDTAHFRILTEMILPDRAGQFGSFRIWSAACSSGQEPYSISMSLDGFHRKHPGFRTTVEIVATDLSEEILAAARQGIYCGLSTVRGLTDEQRKQFFIPNGDCSEVRPDLKKAVTFRKLNLIDSYGGLGRFDAIFCRNVLIYFSTQQKARVIEQMARVLKPGGYLFLGSTESLVDTNKLFEMVTSFGGIVYRLKQ